MAFFPFWVPEGLGVSQFATLFFPAQCKNRPQIRPTLDPINRGKLWPFFHFGFPRGLGEPSFSSKKYSFKDISADPL